METIFVANADIPIPPPLPGHAKKKSILADLLWRTSFDIYLDYASVGHRKSWSLTKLHQLPRAVCTAYSTIQVDGHVRPCALFLPRLHQFTVYCSVHRLHRSFGLLEQNILKQYESQGSLGSNQPHMLFSDVAYVVMKFVVCGPK